MKHCASFQENRSNQCNVFKKSHWYDCDYQGNDIDHTILNNDYMIEFLTIMHITFKRKTRLIHLSGYLFVWRKALKYQIRNDFVPEMEVSLLDHIRPKKDYINQPH